MPALRLARVLLWSPLRRRIRPLDESVIHLVVWPNDLDLNLHMNNGRYLTLMDLGRFDLLGRTGLLRTALRRRWRPMVGSASVRFRRGLGPFRRYALVSRIAAWDQKWFYIEQRFERRGEVVAVGHVKGLLRGPHGNVASADVLAAVGHLDASPPIPAGADGAWVAGRPTAARGT